MSWWVEYQVKHFDNQMPKRVGPYSLEEAQTHKFDIEGYLDVFGAKIIFVEEGESCDSMFLH